MPVLAQAPTRAHQRSGDTQSAQGREHDEAGADANIIFGAVIDPTMADKMRVTVIATGFGGAEKVVEKPAEEKAGDVKPGKVISLFPEEVVTRPKQNVIEAEEAVGSSSYKKAAPGNYYQESSESRIRGTANSERHRVPIFTEADRTIPAYIRRLEDN